MANEPNEVRDAIIKRLRTKIEKEVILANNLLGEMTRYMLQKRSHAEEETRLGLVMKESRYPFKCDFMSLDSRIPSRKGTVENSFPLAFTEAVENVKIVYLVNTDDFMNLLPKGWSIWSTIWSIVLGEREEDSCLVINLSGKVVQDNLISKTLHEVYDIGSNQLDDNHDNDELIMPFEGDHNVYEFIPSFASV
ncbi:hypothetical protein Tco_0388698 [Tanacetum coccineum]